MRYCGQGGKERISSFKNYKRLLVLFPTRNATTHWVTSSVQVLSQAMNDLYLDSYLIPKPPKNFHCSACSLSKSTHQVPSASYKRAENPFELIHTDLSGKFSIPSIGKRLYYISFIDDKTRYSWIAFLSQQSDTTQRVQSFIAQINRQYNSKIQRFRSDNGGEYIDTALQEYFRNQGIVSEMTPPYSHESAGVAERFNRTITTMMRSMMINMQSKFLWAEAAATAVYIKNRLPHSTLPNNQTPYEALKGEKPSIKHLQPFGRKCYVHIPKEARPSGSKLQPRAIEGKFLGYEKSDKIYRIWNPAKPNQVLVSRDVRFPPLEPGEAGITIELKMESTSPEKESTSPEKESTSPSLKDDDLQQLVSQGTPADDSDSELSDAPSTVESELSGTPPTPEKPQRRSQRNRTTPQRYGFGARHTGILLRG